MEDPDSSDCDSTNSRQGKRRRITVSDGDANVNGQTQNIFCIDGELFCLIPHSSASEMAEEIGGQGARISSSGLALVKYRESSWLGGEDARLERPYLTRFLYEGVNGSHRRDGVVEVGSIIPLDKSSVVGGYEEDCDGGKVNLDESQHIPEELFQVDDTIDRESDVFSGFKATSLSELPVRILNAFGDRKVNTYTDGKSFKMTIGDELLLENDQGDEIVYRLLRCHYITRPSVEMGLEEIKDEAQMDATDSSANEVFDTLESEEDPLAGSVFWKMVDEADMVNE